MSRNPHVSVLLAALGTCVAPIAPAQDAWEHRLGVYLMAAGLDGTSQIGPVATDVDVGFGELLEALEIGGMGFWQAEKGDVTVTVDAMYAALAADDTGPFGVRFDVDVDQLILGTDVAYRMNESFQLLAGLRYVSLDMELRVRSPTGATLRGADKQDWIDPYVGANATWPINDAWSFVLRGDIGGFGVGSDFAWNVVARFNWNFSENMFAAFGYRILDMDYENGSGNNLFAYDVAQSGPIAGIAWRF